MFHACLSDVVYNYVFSLSHCKVHEMATVYVQPNLQTVVTLNLFVVTNHGLINPCFSKTAQHITSSTRSYSFQSTQSINTIQHKPHNTP